MGKLEGKVAVITAATSGMALATAKLFVEEGAYVFITGRRKNKLDEAVNLIGRNVTGVQGDAANLADLDRLYETVKREKGKIDILFASAGFGEFARRNQGCGALLRTYLAGRTQEAQNPREHPEPRHHRHAHPRSSRPGCEGVLEITDPTRRNGTPGRDRDRRSLPSLKRFQLR